MKANVIHGDFNPCGGAERLSLTTMQALLEMGIDFDLTTLKNPNIPKLENSFSKKQVSVMKSINKIKVINIIEELRQQQQQQQQGAGPQGLRGPARQPGRQLIVALPHWIEGRTWRT